MSKKKTIRISTFGARITGIISVSLTLVVLGIVALIGVAAHNVTDTVRRNMTLTVQAVPGSGDIELNRIKRLIKAQPMVDSYTYLSAQQVLAQEVQFIGDEVATLLDENPYSAEYTVRMKPSAACADSITALTKTMTADKAVERVIADVTVAESVNNTFNKLATVLLIVAGVLLIISFVLINNTVSLSIYSRRFLIYTMKLVGATPGFIRRPFVAAGLVNGLISGLLASAVLAGAQVYVGTVDPDIAASLDWETSAVVYAALVVLGCMICPTAAWCATTWYLRRNFDALYRK